ncbi:MAG: hypothetical protein C0516_13215 [Gemmatimonas sp.]|nr:hypothetical protein [Gemmatimonas sp.]
MESTYSKPHLTGRNPSRSLEALATLKVSAILSGFGSMSPAMWLVQLYVFFEYVRPQTIYPWLDVLPWSMISLLLAAVACLAEGRFKFTAKSIWLSITLFTATIVLSSVVAFSPEYSWDNRNLWLNWLLLILIIGGGIRDKKELVLLLIAFGLWNIKMTQHGVRSWASIGFSFRPIGVGGAPGWFQNSGEFGIQMCVFLPIVVYFTYGVWPKLGKWSRRFLLCVIASAVISMIATSSRGALVGAAAIAVWAIWRSPHRVRALTAVALLGTLVWLAVPSESKERFREMGDDRSSTTRLTYWKDGIEIANRHPILGIGYKNWYPYYTTFYNPNGQLPHNFMIEAVSEMGYVGLGALVWVIAASFSATRSVRSKTGAQAIVPDRLLWSLSYGFDGALIGFIVSGSFVSVLYYPYLWMNTAMVLALVRIVNSRSTRITLQAQHIRKISRPAQASRDDTSANSCVDSGQE